VNLYTHAIRTMSKDAVDKKTKAIVKSLSDVIGAIDDLLEEPIFLDTIDGEQELALDWTLEMLLKIQSKFEPVPPKISEYPALVDDSYDAD
jgi:hypothetical protein